MTGRTLAQAILERLADLGIDQVFGLPGVHNLAFWECDGAIPAICGVRHEQSAAYAADGLARATGRLGVALTTTGPGAANAVAAFGEAAMSHSRILIISSEVSSLLKVDGVNRGILHEMNDQAQLFAPLASPGCAISAQTPDAALNAIETVINYMTTHDEVAGYIGIPSNLLAQEIAAPSIRSEVKPESNVDWSSALALIEQSERPVVYLGGGAANATGISNFVTKLNAPILTSFAGNGVHASDLVVGAPLHEPEGHQLLLDADLLVMLGTDFDGMNSRNWQAPLPKNVLAVNIHEQPISTNVPQAHLVNAPLQQLQKLTDLISPKKRWIESPSAIGNQMRERLRNDERGSLGIKMIEQIEHAWPTDGNIVVDMTIGGYWMAGYSVQPRSRRLAYPVGWGTLGFGFPAAIGAASVAPTLSLCGDGGLMFALGELATIRQENLPLTLLLIDDGGYGMLRFDQQVFGHHERGVDLFTPQWESMFAAFEFPVTTLTNMDELGAALTANYGRPSVIIYRGVMHPPRTTSPRWREPLPTSSR